MRNRSVMIRGSPMVNNHAKSFLSTKQSSLQNSLEFLPMIEVYRVHWGEYVCQDIPIIPTLIEIQTKRRDKFENLQDITWAFCSERTAKNPLKERVYE